MEQWLKFKFLHILTALKPVDRQGSRRPSIPAAQVAAGRRGRREDITVSRRHDELILLNPAGPRPVRRCAGNMEFEVSKRGYSPERAAKIIERKL